MRSFEIPFEFRSGFISNIKTIRNTADGKKRDYSPSILKFDKVSILIPRHFGFCFGVQSAVEKAFEILDENRGKKIYLISEIIHNPEVNELLKSKGMCFLQDTKGQQLVSWDELKKDDIVIVPAFGTTREIQHALLSRGIRLEKFDTTCPFVERVWNKGEKLGKEGYTIIIHGDPAHEETRATFSRVNEFAKTVIVANQHDAEILAEFIRKTCSDTKQWNAFFEKKASTEFDFIRDLDRIAVVNQTTMLADDTQRIADYLKTVMLEKYGPDQLDFHFGSTRDTLCYATNDNQQAAYEMIKEEVDLAFVIGGYNSSNTRHLVEVMQKKQPTYFISSDMDIINETEVNFFDLSTGNPATKIGYIPENDHLKIAVCSGASCPDATVERVILKLLSFIDETANLELAIKNLNESYNGL